MNEINCPRCNGTGKVDAHKCESCEAGKIPVRTLNFIAEKMIEKEDHYQCMYNHVLVPPAGKIEINFRVHKDNFMIYGMNYGGMYNLDLPNNTVELIDKMINHHSKGAYITEEAK